MPGQNVFKLTGNAAPAQDRNDNFLGTTDHTSSRDEAASSNQVGRNWDVIGLDIDRTQRTAFVGLLEDKTEFYAKLINHEPDMDIIELTKNMQSSPLGHSDRFMFRNFGLSSINQHVQDPDLAQKQLVVKFRESMFPDNGSMPAAFRNHARWLSHLPPLTGTNPLLDSSVRAVTLVHIGRLNNSEPFIMESRPYYGQALRLLNKALQDKKQGMSNETLCSVILLSFYEMFASDNNETWIRHAGGVSALMRARGPERHRNGFDREIFLAYRYTLVIEAFQEDVPCFLAEPAWQKLAEDIHSDVRKAGISTTRIEIFDLAEDFYRAMVVLPELAAQARGLWQAKQNGTPPPYSRAQVLDKMTQARSHFKTTFGLFEKALKKAGHSPTININAQDPLIGIEYDFINTFVSATYTGYWTVLIVLNLCLQGLQVNDKEMVQLYRSENKECALNICRTTAFMLTSSFLGPFFLIFGLRVGLLVYEDEVGANEEATPEADWILRKLFEIGERHMSIAKHIPGYRQGITVDELLTEFRARKKKSTQNDNMQEQMDFRRQVAQGSYELEIPKVTTTSSDYDAPQLGDVLDVWNEQDNFELQQNLDSLNVGATNREWYSRGSSRETTPNPIDVAMNEQQFSQAAATFVMPDMNFFEPSQNDQGYFGATSNATAIRIDDLPFEEQQPDAFANTNTQSQVPDNGLRGVHRYFS